MNNDQLSEGSIKTSTSTIEMYKPKISRKLFIFFILFFDIIMFIIGILLIPENAGLAGASLVIGIIFLIILFTFFSIISYEIIIKKEKDGSRYKPLNHRRTYTSMVIISSIILFFTLWSAITYLFPLITYFHLFSVTPDTYYNRTSDSYFIVFLLAKVSSFVVIIFGALTLFLSIKKTRIALLTFFWLISSAIYTYVVVPPPFGVHFFDPNSYSLYSAVTQKAEELLIIQNYKK